MSPDVEGSIDARDHIPRHSVLKRSCHLVLLLEFGNLRSPSAEANAQKMVDQCAYIEL